MSISTHATPNHLRLLLVIAAIGLLLGLVVVLCRSSRAPADGILPAIGEEGLVVLSSADFAAKIKELEQLVDMQSKELEKLRATSGQRTTPKDDEFNPDIKVLMVEEIASDGSLRGKGLTINGARYGKWEFWSPSGAKAEEGEYSNGKKVGLWRSWNEQGQIVKSGRYVDDLREGVWTFIEANGSMRDFNYRLGKQVVN